MTEENKIDCPNYFYAKLSLQSRVCPLIFTNEMKLSQLSVFIQLLCLVLINNGDTALEYLGRAFTAAQGAVSGNGNGEGSRGNVGFLEHNLAQVCWVLSAGLSEG